MIFKTEAIFKNGHRSVMLIRANSINVIQPASAETTFLYINNLQTPIEVAVPPATFEKMFRRALRLYGNDSARIVSLGVTDAHTRD